MKTIFLIVALCSFTAMTGYSQTKNCCCKKTARAHKIVRHEVATKTTTEPIDQQSSGGQCYTYKKDNIAVTECPDETENSSGDIGYNIENNFTGNYPMESTALNALNGPSMNNTSTEFTVSSPAFDNFGSIPAKYTCEGQQASPPISIANIPAGTKSLALEIYDPHVVGREGVTYMLAWDIDTTSLIPENFVSDHESLNAANQWGYQAMCPVNGTHYYHFVVYALDTKLRLGKHTTKAMLDRAAMGHTLAKGELIGEYNRQLE